MYCTQPIYSRWPLLELNWRFIQTFSKACKTGHKEGQMGNPHLTTGLKAYHFL